MNYRTTCPHCSSVFRVGAEQLDAAQGWVQCGVCGAAFEARASLRMEDGSALPATPAQAAEPAPVAAPPAEATLPAEVEPASAHAPAQASQIAPAGSADEPVPAEIPVGIVQREASALSSIIIIDPDIPVPDDFGPLPQMGAEPASATPAPLMYPPPDSHVPSGAITAADSRTPASAVTAADSSPLPQAASEPASLDVPPAPPRNRPWAWAGAGVLLLALLLAQGAYFLRDRLASRLPQTRPVLEHMCTLLDCTLSLPKNQWVGSCQDLAMPPRQRAVKGSQCETATPLQIVGSDLETEAGGQLRLTLTLGNRDNYAQAWPVLVLTLTDQRNVPLARRSFAPSEYLGDTERIAAGMPPRSEQPLSLPLTVHDLQPMGFDLQLTY